MTRGDLEKGIAALVNKYQEENDYVVVFVSLTRVGLKNETYVTHADTALMRKRDFKSSGQPKRATDGRNNY